MSRQRNFWIPVICGGMILTIGIGARQSFGIFQKPIAADLNVGRELWSFGTALAMLLMGVFSPFVGNLADRFGTARTVAAGGMLYVAGMLMIALATEGMMLTLGNVLSGIGMAAAGFGPIFGAIARQTPADEGPAFFDGCSAYAFSICAGHRSTIHPIKMPARFVHHADKSP